MEEVLWRFYYIGRQICETLDNESLANCRQVNRTWSKFIDDEKFFWIRKIRFCSINSNEPLEKILTGTNLDIVKKLAEVALKFCLLQGKEEYKIFLELLFDQDIVYDLDKRKSGHILYFAAMIGHDEFFKEKIVSKFKEKNPEIQGYSPIHFAARNGHFSVCELIIQNHKAKNPLVEYAKHPLKGVNTMIFAN